jgi:hypothetical protein
MRENGVSDFPDPNAAGEFVYGASVSPAVLSEFLFNRLKEPAPQ